MSTTNSKSIFADSLKSLVKSILRLLIISLAWAMRFIGLALSKTGELIERLIVKKSTL